MWACPRCHATYADARFCPVDGEALTVSIPGLSLERELGRGLAGAVWSARATTGERMAVKILHREWCSDPEMRARFEREAMAAGAVSHPCVAAPIATGALADGRPYLVMELIDGPSLEEMLADGPLPERHAIELAIDLAGALDAVHRAGVIHRDVKPGNVRIGSDARAHLLDFGVARRLDTDEVRLTTGGLTVGTPHYMSPEQCNGDDVGPRADVYALGVVLHRMLTGKVPFDGAAVAVMLAHTARPAPRVRDSAPSITPALDALVARCLSKSAADRPDAAELARALRSLTAARIRFERAATVPAAESRPSGMVRGTFSDSTADLPRPRRLPAAAGVTVAMAAAALAVGAMQLRGEELGQRLTADPIKVIGRPLPDLATTAPDLTVQPRRYLIAADGGVALRLGAPRELAPGEEQGLTIEAWDAEGEPIDTTDLVVTFAGPRGGVTGLAADPTRERGVYRVRARFDLDGDWTVRVFPPVGDTMVTFHLDVGTPIPTS